MNTLPIAEFCRYFNADDLYGRTFKTDIAATARECEALAKRFDVEEIKNLDAHVSFEGGGNGAKLSLHSEFNAEVIQICVVTLEPFVSRIEGKFNYDFVPSTSIDQEAEVDVDPDGNDPPEPIIDGRIDVGELVTEHLGLEIEPFPKAPGAVFDAGEEEDVLDNPFAKLEGFKNR